MVFVEVKEFGIVTVQLFDGGSNESSRNGGVMILRHLVISVLLLFVHHSANGSSRISFTDKELLELLVDLPPKLRIVNVRQLDQPVRDVVIDAVPQIEPPVNAPEEELTDYWLTSKKKYDIPDDVLLRLWPLLVEHKYFLIMNLDILKGRASFVEELYHYYVEAVDSQGLTSTEKQELQDWLIMNSDYLRADLAKKAQGIFFGNGMEGEDYLKLYVDVDWGNAVVLLQQFRRGKDERKKAVALDILLRKDVEGGMNCNQSEYFLEIRKLAENTEAKGFARDRAIDTLVDLNWKGKQDWCLSLFEDPTMREIRDDFWTYDPLSTMVSRDPDEWIPVLTGLVNSKDRTVHNNAVACLLELVSDEAIAEALRPLIPWILDPDWADTGSVVDRLRLVQCLDEVDLLEAAEDLIWVLENEKDRSYVEAAAEALAIWGYRKAVPNLKDALVRQTHETTRQQLASAIYRLDGFSVAEKVDALCALAHKLSNLSEDEKKSDKWVPDLSPIKKDPLDPAVSIGFFIRSTIQPDDDLCKQSLSRIRELYKTKPSAAVELENIVFAWDHPMANRALLNSLIDVRINENMLLSLFSKGRLTMELYGTQLSEMIQRGGVLKGIACVLLRSGELPDQVLRSPDTLAKKALLASARHVQFAVDLALLERQLQSGDPELESLALDCLRYDERPDAWELLFRESNEEYSIVGSRIPYGPGYVSYEEFERWFQYIKKDVITNGGEIVALLSSGVWGGVGNFIIIRKRQEKIEIELHDEIDKYCRRVLLQEKWDDLISFIEKYDIDALPALETNAHDKIRYEYLHLKPNGGFRVSMNDPEWVDGYAKVYPILVQKIRELAQTISQDDCYP